MLVIQVILIALNAIFACAEIAVISTQEARLEKLAEDGNKKAKRLLKLTDNPAKFLATIQVAITLAGFMGSALAAESFSDPIVEWMIGLGVTIDEATLDVLAVIVITLILSYFTLVFGELVPKRLAMKNSEKIALGISGFVGFLAKLFTPVVWLLTVSTNLVLRLFGVDPNADDNDVSEEDIHDIVDSAAKSGSIDDEERDFIQNIFEFDDLTAGEIATHRTDVKILWLDESDEEWYNTIHEKCHMFYPVCGENVDDVVGVLYLKDYFRLEDRNRDAVMENAVKNAYFVPESVKADVLFKNMKKSNKSFAVVLDEYGGMYGIVTMNDLISRLLGDLAREEEESTEESESITKVSDDKWKLVGNIPLEDIAEALEAELPCDDFETFSAMVFSEYGSIPEDGETFELTAWGLKISVTELRDHMIEGATITKLPKEDDSGDTCKDE